jgi:hypothetical protein
VFLKLCYSIRALNRITVIPHICIYRAYDFEPKVFSFIVAGIEVPTSVTMKSLHTPTQLLVPIGRPTKPGKRVASQWGLGNTPSSYPSGQYIIVILTDSAFFLAPALAGFLLDWISTLKMKVIRSSLKSAHIRTTKQFIPEYGKISILIISSIMVEGIHVLNRVKLMY